MNGKVRVNGQNYLVNEERTLQVYLADVREQ